MISQKTTYPWLSMVKSLIEARIIVSIQGRGSMEHNQIHFRAEFTLEVGKIEEFKKLVQDMSRVVEANEPNTIDYQFYLNKYETRCIVHET